MKIKTFNDDEFEYVYCRNARWDFDRNYRRGVLMLNPMLDNAADVQMFNDQVEEAKRAGYASLTLFHLFSLKDERPTDDGGVPWVRRIVPGEVFISVAEHPGAEMMTRLLRECGARVNTLRVIPSQVSELRHPLMVPYTQQWQDIPCVPDYADEEI